MMKMGKWKQIHSLLPNEHYLNSGYPAYCSRLLFYMQLISKETGSFIIVLNHKSNDNLAVQIGVGDSWDLVSTG